MSEEKKEGSCCSTAKACCYGKGIKLLVMLLMGAFIFAAGMWFAKSHCGCHTSGLNYCPYTPAAK